MKAVNKITQYLAQAFTNVEAAREKNGQGSIYTQTLDMLKSAPEEATEDERVAARDAFVALHIAMFTAEALKAVRAAVDAAGKVLSSLAEPEKAAAIGITFDDVPKAAGEAAVQLAASLPMLAALAEHAAEDVDVEHIAEAVWEAGQKRAGASTPVAKPAKGDVTPWQRRVTPSDN